MGSSGKSSLSRCLNWSLKDLTRWSRAELTLPAKAQAGSDCGPCGLRKVTGVCWLLVPLPAGNTQLARAKPNLFT